MTTLTRKWDFLPQEYKPEYKTYISQLSHKMNEINIDVTKLQDALREEVDRAVYNQKAAYGVSLFYSDTF